MTGRLLTAALYGPWCACTAMWGLGVALLAPITDWNTPIRRTRP